MRGFEAEHCYDRFHHAGTRYLVSNYTFTMLAQSGRVAADAFCFPLDVLQEHFRRQYCQMFFIIQMQRAALLMLSNWMSQAMHRRRAFADSGFEADLRDVRRALAEFTHRYWFTNVSNQEQARELFALMHRHADNAALYSEVLNESHLAKEEIDHIVSRRVQNGTLMLTSRRRARSCSSGSATRASSLKLSKRSRPTAMPTSASTHPSPI